MKSQMQYDYERQHLADSLSSAANLREAHLKIERQQQFTFIGIAGVVILLVFSFFILRNNKLLASEKKRSEDLLLNILPPEVAAELKLSGSSKAKHFNNVTVLFTDFVGFTSASVRMTPDELVNELHACFKAFDNIIAKYDVEKIKTIGDAYLAVCGLPHSNPKHAENIIQAALDIRDFMEERLAKMGSRTFPIRIGVHSGNLVAGIVGVRKFVYDIWGDTVNTAARMEQSSEAGKINISEATYLLVKDNHTCTYRGEIEAKNKGMLKMYFVEK